MSGAVIYLKLFNVLGAQFVHSTWQWQSSLQRSVYQHCDLQQHHLFSKNTTTKAATEQISCCDSVHLAPLWTVSAIGTVLQSACVMTSATAFVLQFAFVMTSERICQSCCPASSGSLLKLSAVVTMTRYIPFPLQVFARMMQCSNHQGTCVGLLKFLLQSMWQSLDDFACERHEQGCAACCPT